MSRCLRVDRVARRLECVETVEPRQHMVQHKLNLLLCGEAVQRAGFELVKRIVGRCKNRHAVKGAVQLAGDLGTDLGLFEQAQERRVLASFFQNGGQVQRLWGGARCDGCSFCMASGDEECGQDKKREGQG